MAVSRIMYIEKKGDAHTGESFLHGGYARIGRVTFSKTMRSVHYNGKAYRKVSGYKYNFIEEETGDYYWISGCKKDGTDRLYNERVPIQIDGDVREEYWRDIRQLPCEINVKVRNKKN